jgi:hypothetical protein
MPSSGRRNDRAVESETWKDVGLSRLEGGCAAGFSSRRPGGRVDWVGERSTAGVSEGSVDSRAGRALVLGIGGLYVAGTGILIWLGAVGSASLIPYGAAWGIVSVLVAGAAVLIGPTWLGENEDTKRDVAAFAAAVVCVASWMALGLWCGTMPVTHTHTAGQVGAAAVGLIAGGALTFSRRSPAAQPDSSSARVEPESGEEEGEEEGEVTVASSTIVAIWSRPEFHGLSDQERAELAQAGEVMRAFIDHKVFLSDMLKAMRTATAAITRTFDRGVTSPQLADALGISEAWIDSVIARRTGSDDPAPEGR